MRLLFAVASQRQYLVDFTVVSVYFMRRCTTQTSTDLPVCKTFSKPLLCSPVIRALLPDPCIISGLREKAAAVHPPMEHHIDATDTDGAWSGAQISPRLSANERKPSPGCTSPSTTEKQINKSRAAVKPPLISRQHGASRQQRPPPPASSSSSSSAASLSLCSSARSWHIRQK